MTWLNRLFDVALIALVALAAHDLGATAARQRELSATMLETVQTFSGLVSSCTAEDGQ